MQIPAMLEGTVRDNLYIRAAGIRGDFSEERLGRTLKETISICAANQRSIAAVILCCFSKSNIPLAVAFKHLNNKLAVYIREAVECFGEHTSRYS
jgi:S-methylmethionine-dependent homocysteine/selenocysteine methylase